VTQTHLLMAVVIRYRRGETDPRCEPSL